MLIIGADPEHLGARIGFISVLHSWGSAMTHHPHVHMIAPGGGVSPDGLRWLPCRRGFFLPVRALSKLFRRLMLEKLAAAHKAGKLKFFGEHAHLAAADACSSLSVSKGPAGRAKCHPRQRGSIRHDPIQEGLHRIEDKFEPPFKGWQRRRLLERTESCLFFTSPPSPRRQCGAGQASSAQRPAHTGGFFQPRAAARSASELLKSP